MGGFRIRGRNTRKQKKKTSLVFIGCTATLGKSSHQLNSTRTVAQSHFAWALVMWCNFLWCCIVATATLRNHTLVTGLLLNWRGGYYITVVYRSHCTSLRTVGTHFHGIPEMMVPKYRPSHHGFLNSKSWSSMTWTIWGSPIFQPFWRCFFHQDTRWAMVLQSSAPPAFWTWDRWSAWFSAWGATPGLVHQEHGDSTKHNGKIVWI